MRTYLTNQNEIITEVQIIADYDLWLAELLEEVKGIKDETRARYVVANWHTFYSLNERFGVMMHRRDDAQQFQFNLNSEAHYELWQLAESITMDAVRRKESVVLKTEQV